MFGLAVASGPWLPRRLPAYSAVVAAWLNATVMPDGSVTRWSIGGGHAEALRWPTAAAYCTVGPTSVPRNSIVGPHGTIRAASSPAHRGVLRVGIKTSLGSLHWSQVAHRITVRTWRT